MKKQQVIYIEDSVITILPQNNEDYISLTDMAHSQMQEHVIFRWLSLKSTIEYIGEWESLYNPNFNYTEFGTIKNMAGSNNFVLSVKSWIEKTNELICLSNLENLNAVFINENMPQNERLVELNKIAIQQMQILEDTNRKLLLS
jgi:hypothetical protein